MAAGGERAGWWRRLGRWITRRYYGRLEITDRERIPATGPVLLCANHANALIDPVLLGIAARRPVRFLAKAPLFAVPVLGRLLRALGMIPAYRVSDDPRQVRRNLQSLDAGAVILAQGHALGIFPEGQSTEHAHLDTLRSGAARLALQAVEAGAAGLVIVPVGIVYEQKDRAGSDVWVRVGEPMRVAEWLRGPEGTARAARRALTEALTARLRAVVVHLDEPAWEPFLDDLEALLPAPSRRQAGHMAPLRQRARLAAAINHFMATDRPRADAVAGQIAAFRDAVRTAGLPMSAPLLRQRGWRVACGQVWAACWLLVALVPALLGTLHHLVPHVLTRALGIGLDRAGRRAIATNRLLVGVPVFLGWYVAVGAWMLGYYTTWFTTAWLFAMPLAGLVALEFWRGARRTLAVWSHQLRLGLRPARLAGLRAERAALRDTLRGLADAYAAVAPRAASEPRPSRRRPLFRVAVGAAVAALAFALGWVLLHPLTAGSLLGDGLDLAGLAPAQLRAALDRDRVAIGRIAAGLDELEADARMLERDFAERRRSFVTQADNDALRELLRRYLAYRTALLRVVWKFQRHADVAEPALRLESFLLGYAAASILHDAALRFVHGLSHEPRTIAKLNEPEPHWGIPPGLYDTIRRNLANPEHRRLLQAARDCYAHARPEFERHGLGASSEYAPLHQAIARAAATAARLDRPLDAPAVALADLASLLRRVRYATQAALSTWIGDFKIRAPRGGRSLIAPEQLADLAGRLEPGDILLERRNWYLSNAFLPGFWPHGAVYVGTVRDLEARGLVDAPHVAAHLDEFRRPDPEGHAHVIVEAVSEGVVFSSLEHSIGGADAVAVLRANLPRAEIDAAIVRAFSFAGRPYDFEFDFSTTDALVCTEVVYRAYGGNSGPIAFPVVEIMGRPTMPAINLVQKLRDERHRPNPQLRFVAFIDGDEAGGTSRLLTDEDALVQTLDRAALTWLQGLERGELRGLWGLGPLGWVLLALTGLAGVGEAVLAWRARRARPPA